MGTINQPAVKSVVGEITLCEKEEAQFDKAKFSEISGKTDKKKADKPKKEQKPKEQKPKAEKKVEAAPEAPVEKKAADPWEGCGKFTVDMDSWKRFYSNND